MKTADIIAIVVTHDSAAALPPCLAALARQGVAAIVVDNASRDDSASIAERAGARVIRNARNEGYGRAMNIGMRAAASVPALAGSAGLCLLLNPDLVLDPGSVAALEQAALRYPRSGLLAPRLIEPDGRLFYQARSLLAPYLRNQAGAPCSPEGDCCAPFLSGACLVGDCGFLLSIGGFDETIFLFYEDDDLCRRVIEAGRPLLHVHGAVARHARGASSAKAPGRIFRSRWHMAWSEGYVARKYRLPEDSWRTLAVNAVKFCAATLTFNRDRMERYAGSAAGAYSWLRGRSALAREGLA